MYVPFIGVLAAGVLAESVFGYIQSRRSARRLILHVACRGFRPDGRGHEAS